MVVNKLSAEESFKSVHNYTILSGLLLIGWFQIDRKTCVFIYLVNKLNLPRVTVTVIILGRFYSSSVLNCNFYAMLI